MKRLITILTVLVIGLASFTSNVNAASLSANYQHMTKAGKPDKRYNDSKHLKKDGSMDMRYKTSKKAAAKKKKS